jgi:transcription-repair coupling factor (superfamily II helicase)
VSNIGHLLGRYRVLPQIGQLTKKLAQTPTARVQLKGIIGAQSAFVVAGTFEAQRAEAGNKGVYHLCISESKEEAAYLQNDIAGIIDPALVHFFPDSFKRPAFFDDLNSTQILQRAEVVNKITSVAAQPAGGIIITYPEALFEMVVAPEVLNQNRIEINKGERLDVDFVIEILVNYGFERTDFVYEPGQFSIRGGIIDLFSYGNNLPYRVELFDDEVESIRLFDPLTQMSQRNIERVSIVPNLNTRFTQDQKVSLFGVLPENTVIWIKDVQFLVDRLQYCFEKVDQFAQKVSTFEAAELREIFRDRAFVFPHTVLEELGNLAIVYWD